MNQTTKKISRKKRVRAKLAGQPERPRLHVFRSNKYIYAQIIDDVKAKTVVAASEKEIKSTQKQTKLKRATAIGELLAKKAKTKKITTVKFDRGAYKYHGRVKAIAEAARKGGLKF